MKDEGKEIQGELVTIDKPAYDVVEQADDEAIIAMMTGQAIQDYVYSFKQGGRVVQGLTLAGINEAANRRGGITVEDIQYEDREHSWLVIVKATDTFTGSSRYGAYEQPKRMGNREDPFAFTKAVHKAQRNAIKQLLPVPIIKEVLNFYLQRMGQAPAQDAQPSQPTSAQPNNDKISQAQKAAFAAANKLKDRLEAQGISQMTFWNYVKRRYGVESRNDMTERQWTELSAEIHAAESSKQLFEDFIARIKKVMAAMNSSEVPPSEEAAPEIVDAEITHIEKDKTAQTTPPQDSPRTPPKARQGSTRTDKPSGRSSPPQDSLF